MNAQMLTLSFVVAIGIIIQAQQLELQAMVSCILKTAQRCGAFVLVQPARRLQKSLRQ